jgi:hypothetical protein
VRSIEVSDERLPLLGDGDRWEQEVACLVDASRGIVGRVVFTLDIASDDLRVGMEAGDVDKLEYFVGRAVPAASLPPALDDTPVVAIHFVEWFVVTARKYCCNKEVEAECFGPANVSPVAFPFREEAPSSPAVTNDDANACL